MNAAEWLRDVQKSIWYSAVGCKYMDAYAAHVAAEKVRAFAEKIWMIENEKPLATGGGIVETAQIARLALVDEIRALADGAGKESERNDALDEVARRTAELESAKAILLAIRKAVGLKENDGVSLLKFIQAMPKSSDFKSASDERDAANIKALERLSQLNARNKEVERLREALERAERWCHEAGNYAAEEHLRALADGVGKGEI